MRIALLRLENYRRFARAELEFPDGVTGLVGRNGAGKSTIVEAIGWALFGHEASRTGRDHLRLNPARDARVHLAFELGGESYEVTRELAGKGGQHQATVKVGGRVLVAAGANSAKEATAAVERALRMDRDAFFTSLVARQGELNALSDLTPARRKEVVMRMLRIDAIDGAIALAREERRRLQAHVEGLSGQQADPAALAAKARELREARAAEAAAGAEAARTLEGLEASLGAVSQARAAAEEQRRRHDGLAARAGVLQTRAEAAQRAAARSRDQLAELAALEAEAARLAPQAEEHVRLRTVVEGLEALRDRHRERARLVAEAEELEREVEASTRAAELAAAEAAQTAGVRALLEEARGARLAREQALADARAAAAQLEATTRDAEGQLAQTAARRGELAHLGHDAPCPTCERSLAEALPRLLARLDEELGGHRARLEALQRRAGRQGEALGLAQREAEAGLAREDALKKRAEHLFRREAEAALLQRRRAETEIRLRARRGAVEALGPSLFDEESYLTQKRSLAALAQPHERWLQLRGQLQRRPALAEELARLEGEERGAREEAARTEAERAALRFDRAARQALEERFAGLQGRVRAQAVERERRRAAVERIDAELARLAEEEARQREREARLAELRREIVLLERLAGERDAGLLADFRSHLMGRVRPALAQRAGELFRACTDGRYEGLELSEDYDLQVVEGGQALPLARFSGGEADLANLCLRIAVGEVLAERAGEHLGFLALDEVLGSQDEQRRAAILGALAHLRGRFRQILLITHIEEVKDALEHVVYVEPGPDGTSRLSVAEDALRVPA